MILHLLVMGLHLLVSNKNEYQSDIQKLNYRTNAISFEYGYEIQVDTYVGIIKALKSLKVFNKDLYLRPI